jgi:hypothetical protein
LKYIDIRAELSKPGVDFIYQLDVDPTIMKILNTRSSNGAHKSSRAIYKYLQVDVPDLRTNCLSSNHFFSFCQK